MSQNNKLKDTTYYFISDLHLVADCKNPCEIKEDLITFLKELSKSQENAELIIVGDTFGMWEMTKEDSQKKLHRIIKEHQELFNQFKSAGKKIKITIIPGNHDQELFFIKDAAITLRHYNIHLEKQEHIIRKIGNKKIWIEHGSQHDDFNRFPEFKKKYAAPFGYFMSRTIVASANKYAEKGKDSWLQDIASVYPNEEVPSWIFSNYFYKEMHPFIRYTVLPFLLLLTVSALFGFGLLLNRTHIIDSTIVTPAVFGNIKFVGGLIEMIIMIDIIILVLAAAVAVPYFIITRDVKNAMRRYGMRANNSLKIQKEHKYLDAASRIFHENNDVKFFIYGHTHQASIKRHHGRYVINTGTWIKRLHKVKSIFTFLPSVYFPSYRLSYIKISKIHGTALLQYREIKKPFYPDLTFLQKIVILTRDKTEKAQVIPDARIPLKD